ncbi:MAG: M13 family metallopeptidase [bacterium]|nr:M13 family metallopeptidase [bacterium]
MMLGLRAVVRNGRNGPGLITVMHLVLAAALVGAGCDHGLRRHALPDPVVSRDEVADGRRCSGIDLSLLDRTIAPGDDFYAFANGAWLQAAPQQEQCASYGAYDIADERILRDLLSLMRPAAGDDDPDSLREFVRAFFASGMDQAAIESIGLSALSPELAAIDGVQDEESLSRVLARLQLAGVTPFFKIHRPANWELLGTNHLYLRQTSLGLADNDISGRTADERVVGAYWEYMTETFGRLGSSPRAAATLASRIIALERRLAAVAMSQAELRDFKQNYNLLSLGRLDKLVPGVAWQTFFATLGMENPDQVVVGQPKYFREIGRVIGQGDWGLIRGYLKWALVLECAPYLSSDIEQAHAAVVETIRGRPMRPRSPALRVAAIVNAEAPDAVGSLYLREFLPESSRARVQAIIANLRAAFHRRILNSDWLSERTKTRALDKLAAMRFRIGGAEQSPSHPSIDAADSAFLRNVFKARMHRLGEHLGRIGQPVNGAAWYVAAQSSNSWYAPSRNTIILTAGGINSTFRPDADDAYNYGSFAETVAHEMTHAFDQQGRLYDEAGKRRDWWSWRDAAAFKHKARKFAKHYGAYTVLDGTPVDGNKTLDENVADLGGLSVAFDAYLLSLGDKDPPVLDGFTGRQRFFLAFAQKWREVLSECAMRKRAAGWHAPPRFRANGPVYNSAGFYEAFPDAAPGQSALPPDERITIW